MSGAPAPLFATPAQTELPSEADGPRAQRDYGAMDTPAEAAFDDLVALIARICGAPIAIVSLTDHDHQWFKASHGLGPDETPRAVAFCAHAAGLSRELLIVPDTTRDPRFAGDPFVTAPHGLRFYAGAPLITSSGRRIGALCVMDRVPRELAPDQCESLRVLGRQVMVQLELGRGLNEARLNHERLKNSQRIAGLGDWEYDIAADRMDWSAEMRRILGVTGEEIAPNTDFIHLHVHPDDLALVQRERKASAEEARRVHFEHRIVRADGEVRHVHQIIETRFDPHGRPTHESGTMQDITERKLAEVSLRQSEERYRQMFERNPSPIWVFDEHTFAFLAVNDAAVAIFGYTRVEFLGMTVADILPPGHTPDVLESEDATRRPFHAAGRFPYRTKDGAIVPVEVFVHVIDFAGRPARLVLAVDMTDSEAAVAALRQSEERFKGVARAVSDVVWDWDLVADTLWWNEGFQATFGFGAEEIEPGIASWVSRLHPEERASVLEGIQRAIAGDAEVWDSEYRFRCKDGTHAFVQNRGYILRDAAGKGVRMVGGMRDLTSQKKMEAEYLRSQRMDSIGTLAGGIAHDLNNVLAPILMAIELLKLDSAGDSRRYKILDTIHVSCRRGADLVRQVLSFARGLDGQRVAIRLPTLIDDLTGIMRETFPRNIGIFTDVAADLWPVAGDPTQLHQVLLNLAVNARDAMPHGGALTISASNVTLDAQYAGTSPEAKAGAYVLLQVADTGEGIPPEVREKIFEPFFTTKEVGKGTGIGLATVHTVVKGHGGFLSVESEVGRGTTFKIHLPADPLLRPVLTTPPVPVEPPRGRDELVLVVDDEFSIRDITRQTLEAFGYRVITAGDGAEALAIYAKQPTQIALVLTDMMMPVLDGATFSQVIMRINPDVRVIAASGLEVNENIAKATRVGVHDFLRKPYTAGTLLQLMREVLDRPTKSG
ncbi:MAG: PAS domain-containing protein [Burkholderiales bacterium]|nr:PAS domain-containing protein [Opitutaceae bacterium]